MIFVSCDRPVLKIPEVRTGDEIRSSAFALVWIGNLDAASSGANRFFLRQDPVRRVFDMLYISFPAAGFDKPADELYSGVTEEFRYLSVSFIRIYVSFRRKEEQI